MKKEQFNVTGMTCAACSARVEKAVGKLPGVDKIAVNLLKNSMVVEYDETALDTQKIIGAVTEAGYGASLKEASQQGKAAKTMQVSANDIARQEYEAVKKRLKTPETFTGVCRAAFVYLHGAYDGLAAAGDFPRRRKCHDFFADAFIAGYSGSVY